MKTKLMALEALNGMIDIAQMTMGGRTPFGQSLGLSDIPDDADGPLPKAIRAISALEADIAQPVEPYAWCITSTNSADWCFSATKSGVMENAKLMDKDCQQTAPFPIFTEPQEPTAPAWILVSERLPGTPDHGEGVLILRPVTGGKEPFLVVDYAWHYAGQWTRQCGKTYRQCGYWDEITHWMPLPPAPGAES